MKAPFPWFGGKSRCAAQVWQALGDVGNYVEPFAGSLAVLLARPTPPDVETVNDSDCYLANFWRAVQRCPDDVARWADWPVSEIDLHARHSWLLSREDFRQQMRSDPDYCDPKIAGWWVWGLCAWIGDGWCASESTQIPMLSSFGCGVHSRAVRSAGIGTVMAVLSERLRSTRIACGDWERVLTKSVLLSPISTRRHKCETGVFLDPPYSEGNMSYSEHSAGISARVREWAIAHGDNPRLRIVLCGYEGEHTMPQSWRVISRVENGGYGNQSGNVNVNKKRERLWLSPHCLPVGDQSCGENLFDARSV